MVTEREKMCALGCAKSERIGALLFRRLKDAFPSCEALWCATHADLLSRGMAADAVQAFDEFRRSYDPEVEYEKIRECGVEMLVWGDDAYPSLLSRIYDPPYVLFYKGVPPNDGDSCLAVVGTRRVTSYGKTTTHLLVRELAKKFVIVSGLAFGVDSLAHQATLESGGRTIAVLGTGIDEYSLYPSVHRGLSEKIIESGGCLLSEYPPFTRGQKWFFPQRNRIIAGLSLGTLVIEAGEKSGSLITAHAALNENREVFAVPGPITSAVSCGTNDLIKKGARLVTCAQDIAETFSFDLFSQVPTLPNTYSEEESKICAALSSEPIHIDDLCGCVCLDIQTMSSTLLIMEMKGQVKNIGGLMYIKL